MTPSQFKRLSKSKKAILVAQDVLQQIKAKKYIPAKGSYIINVQHNIEEGDIRKQFDKIKTCKACALGSMLLSCINLGNNITTDDLYLDMAGSVGGINSPKISELFTSIFDPYQLLLIETCFESNNGSEKYADDVLNQKLSDDDIDKCQNFYCKYTTDLNRLKAICNNIIKNNGVFKLK